MITFSSLTKEIRNWIASDTVTYLIIDLNKRLDLKDEQQKTIALLISRLVTKDLEPQNFIPELAKSLNIGFASAKVIAQEIIEKVLKNIEKQLRTNLGIDTTKILLGVEIGTPYIPSTPPPPPPPVAPQPARLVQTPAGPQPLKISPTPPGDQPYIIYKERPELRETPTPVPKPVAPKPPEVNPVRSKPPIAAGAAPSAERTSNGVKIPIKRTTPTKPGETRMVHYSNLRTPLNQ